MREHEPWCNKVQEGGNSYAFECDCGAADEDAVPPVGQMPAPDADEADS